MSWAPERERPAAGPLNICHGCGQINPPEARFCRRCRENLERPREPSSIPRPGEPTPRRGMLVDPRGLVATGLLAGAAVAVLLASGPGGAARRPHHAIKAARPAASRTSAKPATAPVPGPVVRVPARPVRRPAGPLAVVQTYWRDVAQHRFASAYRLLVPGSLAMTAAAFVAYERGVGVAAVHFTGQTAIRSAGQATVAVESLVTHDARFGCQSWSGSYALTADAHGYWRIARAMLAPGACSTGRGG